ncbi:thiamine phosphate synthase [Qipengyuania flava]|uniref:thiamine phosphate synthase n=1 Tax=Qipengyuania flava TaxID=192812 RepID=UPI001E640DDE|nr:thiamine phosphate synthase [Qipengyuania flava]
MFRHYHLEESARRQKFAELAGLARALGHTVILAGHEDWGADGHYGRPDRLGAGLRLATAHDAAELAEAVAAQADGIFVSPVFATASHPGADTLGAAGFHALVRDSSVPVIALGGMNAASARELAWPRWGAIDGLGSTKRA